MQIPYAITVNSNKQYQSQVDQEQIMNKDELKDPEPCSLNDELDVEGFLIPKKYPSNNSSMNVAVSPNQGKSPTNSFNCNIFDQRVQGRTESTASSKNLTDLQRMMSASLKQNMVFQVDELDMARVTSRCPRGNILGTIKEVSDSRGSSVRASKNSPKEIMFCEDAELARFSFEGQENEPTGAGKSQFASPVLIGLVESIGASSDEEDSDDEISVFEGDLMLNPAELEEEGHSSPYYESSIEMEILMNGLNNNNEQIELGNIQGQNRINIQKKSFNCCFSLFTSKDLESRTDGRNIENKQKVEFLRFTEPCRNKKRRGSLPDLEPVEGYRARFMSCPELEDRPCKEIQETTDYDEDYVEMEHMIKDDDTCPLCEKAIRKGVHVTCYDLCEHFYHEECIVDTLMKKWMDKDCKNNMCLLCPKCTGVEKWRPMYSEL